MPSGAALALAAAVLFGLSAPATKPLAAAMQPWLLAGLLYLSSGAALALYLVCRRAGAVTAREARLRRDDLPWLAGAVLAGGLVAPVLLMFALAWGSASQAALLLNLEGVFTVLLAWLVFREHVSPRIAIGMVCIVAGAAALAWTRDGGFALDPAAVLVAGTSLAWALDNNLTRRVSAADPVEIAAIKCGVAGAVNVGAALGTGAAVPPAGVIAAAAVVGVLAYGISLVLFIVALRRLGAARTAAYFSTAPFVGAIGGTLFLAEPLTPRFVLAGISMAIGVWLQLTEHHEHQHTHEALEHEHLHSHDDHHQHAHAPGIAVTEPHSHVHAHAPLRHRHPHHPDVHHRHSH